MTNALPARIHVLAKPTGAICNLACSYCFFLDKETLYPGSSFRMSKGTLETYIRQMILGQEKSRFSFNAYLQFEEALVTASLGESTPLPGDSALEKAYQVILVSLSI